MAAVRGIGNLCSACPCRCRRWSGRTLFSISSWPPRFAQTQSVASSTHYPLPSPLSNRRTDQAVQKPELFSAGPSWLLLLLLLLLYLRGKNRRCCLWWLFGFASLRRGEATAAPRVAWWLMPWWWPMESRRGGSAAAAAAEDAGGAMPSFGPPQHSMYVLPMVSSRFCLLCGCLTCPRMSSSSWWSLIGAYCWLIDHGTARRHGLRRWLPLLSRKEKKLIAFPD